MLHVSTIHRLTARQVLEDPWITVRINALIHVLCVLLLLLLFRVVLVVKE